MDNEREKIVAWLSRETAKLEATGAGMTRGEAAVVEAIALTIRAIVRRIRAGEHLERPGP